MEIDFLVIFCSVSWPALEALSCEDVVPAPDNRALRRVSAKLLFRLSAAVVALRKLLRPVLVLVYDLGRSLGCFCSTAAGRLRYNPVLPSNCGSPDLLTEVEETVFFGPIAKSGTFASGALGLEDEAASLVRLDLERLKMNLKAVGGEDGCGLVA